MHSAAQQPVLHAMQRCSTRSLIGLMGGSGVCAATLWHVHGPLLEDAHLLVPVRLLIISPSLDNMLLALGRPWRCPAGWARARECCCCGCGVQCCCQVALPMLVVRQQGACLPHQHCVLWRMRVDSLVVCNCWDARRCKKTLGAAPAQGFPGKLR